MFCQEAKKCAYGEGEECGLPVFGEGCFIPKPAWRHFVLGDGNNQEQYQEVDECVEVIKAKDTILSNLSEIKRLAAENEKLAEVETDFKGSGFLGRNVGRW